MDKSGKKNHGKTPARLPKSEREKKKREHLNENFLALADCLEISDQNNGKAALLIEATRFMKEILSQIECLRKENATLVSEFHYVSAERDELRDDNSSLESQVAKLQKEIKSRDPPVQLDLNSTPPEAAVISHDNSSALVFSTMQTYQQTMDPVHATTTFCSNVQVYPTAEAEELNPGHILKPHARYPTPSDQWPSLVLDK